MGYASDRRVVLTLDAGGTKFAFAAVQGDRLAAGPVTLPSNAHDLPLCLETIVEGFARVRETAPAPPVAISFAFPGPADYPGGIIGGLGNLPAFKEGGVALGPMLADRFGVPVFLNNDGDLFAFGEAIAGFLPWVNGLLAEGGSPKRFRNLFGATFGTGFGGGIVQDGRLWIGDNSAGGEIWLEEQRKDRELRRQWEQQHPLGWIEHRLAFSGAGQYGKWLQTKNCVIRINQVLFLHGGISPKYVSTSIREINDRLRADLKKPPDQLQDPIFADPVGPLWYRGMAQAPEDELAAHVDAVLAACSPTLDTSQGRPCLYAQQRAFCATGRTGYVAEVYDCLKMHDCQTPSDPSAATDCVDQVALRYVTVNDRAVLPRSLR